MISNEGNGGERPVSRAATIELLRKYDRPGPRYTSYPTAVEFDESVDAGVYEEHLARADRTPDEPLSVYVHLPFCDHRCLFCGCHVIISPNHDRARPYLGLLQREIELLAARLPHRRRVSQLHLGGGTPTYHSPEELRTILRHLFQFFEVTDDAELAVEVDPRVTRDEHVDVLAELGFNRISLGVQDFTPAVQEAVERVQSVEETAHVIEHARSRGYRGINIDLIYGLPFQTPDSFERSVETILDLGADRAAVYSFAFVPWIRGHQKRIEDEDLPSPETKLNLFALARERFLEAGYEPIGMDHFAKPDDELARARREGRLRRNFQGYTVIPATDVVGIGISAISDLAGAYAQNHKKLSTYEDAVGAGGLPVERGIVRTPDDEVRRAVIHELMCNFRVEFDRVERAYPLDFNDYFARDIELLRPYEQEGMVTISDRAIAATPVGELFVRNLAMCFDRYYREKYEGGDKPVFSRTV